MMTKEQTLMVLQVLKRKLQGLRIFRVIEELFSLYIIIKVFTADSQVNLLGVNFTEGRAIELMVLLLVIEFCLTRIQTNYKQVGQQLIETLKDLTEQEKRLVQQFKRY
ncbi:hypothetical protein [Latilactobacillus sakei]|uniref:hypothetical protein n=1 Tax=Latilactobacillus sakei TaxID=1599 RepID=UPI001E4AA329|nr:hypothetical protein [Latilactobacillus sakei]